MEFTPIPEAAEVLKISAAHLRALIKAGTWPYYRVGKRVRVDVEEIKRLTRREG